MARGLKMFEPADDYWCISTSECRFDVPDDVAEHARRWLSGMEATFEAVDMYGDPFVIHRPRVDSIYHSTRVGRERGRLQGWHGRDLAKGFHEEHDRDADGNRRSEAWRPD